jgi:hypothetical protein
MTRARTILIAALAVCGLALAGAGTASAATDMPVVGKPATVFNQSAFDVSSCDNYSRGDVCAWIDTYGRGGMYHYSGDDRNLWNDHFERADTQYVVARQISSILNDGAKVAGYDDVILLDGRGHSKCLPYNAYWVTLGPWNDTITGFYWGNCA